MGLSAGDEAGAGQSEEGSCRGCCNSISSSQQVTAPSPVLVHKMLVPHLAQA